MKQLFSLVAIATSLFVVSESAQAQTTYGPKYKNSICTIQVEDTYLMNKSTCGVAVADGHYFIASAGGGDLVEGILKNIEIGTHQGELISSLNFYSGTDTSWDIKPKKGKTNGKCWDIEGGRTVICVNQK